MKKISALAISMILLVSIFIPLVSSNIHLSVDVNSLEIIDSSDPLDYTLLGNHSEAIILEKTIKDGENWVNTYTAKAGETIRFRIKATYNDWDGEPGEPGEIDGNMLTNITIIDRLPSELIFLGNSNPPETGVSHNDKFIMWVFDDIILNNTESIIIEFDAVGNINGTFLNNADVAALEYDYNEYRCNTTYATIIITSDNNSHLTKYIDVDDDTMDEKAIDENDDLSDGYEVFEDPDGSSHSIKSIDGDNDLKIDHFIDTDNDEIPERYWDPDDDILTDITIRDVDYDKTNEWVYDSDGDAKPDKYYDPNDGKIHEYIVYELTVNKIGNGYIQKNPDGVLFLKDFTVTLNAVAAPGWKFVNYSGDESSTNNFITVTMNKDKEITALFINSIIVDITKPASYHKYFLNIGRESDDLKPQIIGPITIKVKAESDIGIDRVEFYINNIMRNVDYKEPYRWTWLFRPLGDEQNYTIKVTAIDKNGNENSDSITVYRPQINYKRLLLFATVGGLFVLTLLRLRNAEPDGVIPVQPDNDSFDSNRPPVIDIGGPYSGRVGIPILFDASNTYDPDGDILTFEWNFGDGSIGHGEKQTHTYNKEGEYIVTLTVTDSEGNYDTETISILITNGSELLGENDLFWYIVTTLAVIITIAVGLLYVRGKIYE